MLTSDIAKNKIVQNVVRKFYPYGALRKVHRGPLSGFKFYVSPSVGFTYAMGIESMNWEFLGEKIKPGMLVYDIGANRGQMGLFFSKYVGSNGKVFCFEPMENLVTELKNNLAVNQVKNVQVYPYALSSHNGKAVFQYAEDKSTQGKLENVENTYVTENTRSVEVQTMTLDSFITDDNNLPDILKIDVEGAAGEVFKGATNLLDHKPKIYLELHGPDEQKAVGEYLVPRGYIFSNMKGEIVSDPVNEWTSPLWCSFG